jgi:hypothetical protein
MKSNVQANITDSRARTVGILRILLFSQDWRDILNHNKTWLIRHLITIFRDFLITGMLRYSKPFAFAHAVLLARETTWALLLNQISSYPAHYEPVGVTLSS